MISATPLASFLSVYPEVHAKLDMQVGKKATVEEFTATTWEDFGREIGMGAPFVRRRASTLAETTSARIDGAADGISAAGFDSPDLHRFADLIRGRAEGYGPGCGEEAVGRRLTNVLRSEAGAS